MGPKFHCLTKLADVKAARSSRAPAEGARSRRSVAGDASSGAESGDNTVGSAASAGAGSFERDCRACAAAWLATASAASAAASASATRRVASARARSSTWTCMQLQNAWSGAAAASCTTVVLRCTTKNGPFECSTMLVEYRWRLHVVLASAAGATGAFVSGPRMRGPRIVCGVSPACRRPGPAAGRLQLPVHPRPPACKQNCHSPLSKCARSFLLRQATAGTGQH